MNTLVNTNLETAMTLTGLTAESLRVEFTRAEVCTPLIDECEGFRPSSDTYRFYIVSRIINSGISDYEDDLDLTFSASDMLIVNDDETILS